MSLLESVAAAFVGKAGETIWGAVTRAYSDWRVGRNKRLAVSFNQQGTVDALLEQEGIYLGSSHGVSNIEPVILNGIFLADSSLAEYVEALLDHDEKVVLLFIYDEQTGEVFLLQADFDGYEMGLWPGLYSLYAYIIDPLEDEVLAIGFPDWGDLEDPNPIQFEGSGPFPLDFVLFDPDVEDDLDEEDFDEDDFDEDWDEDDDFDDDDW